MISITKVFHFEAAHSLSEYDGPCKNIHGHSYQLHITVSGNKFENCGMLIDFKQLKDLVELKVINELDHSLILKSTPSNSSLIGYSTKLIWLEEEPSVEYLIQFIAEKIKVELPEFIVLKKVKLYETHSCYAEWECDPIS